MAGWREPRIAYRHRSYYLTVEYYLQVIKSLKLRIPSKGIVIDVGCGKGYMVEFFRKLGLQAIGLDLSKEMLKEAKKSALEVVLGDARYIPFRSSATQIVTCFEVLEHVIEPQKVLSEIYRVLSNGGIFIATMPLKHPINVVVDFLRGEKTHLTMLTAKEWLAMISSFLNIVGYKTLFVLPIPPTLFRRYFILDLGLLNTHLWLRGVKHDLHDG